jgi:hypothetical protein
MVAPGILHISRDLHAAKAPTKVKNTDQIVWQNPRPCSTRFCRPLKIIFQQETHDLIKKEVKNIEDQIANLVFPKIDFEGKDVTVECEFKLTMIDGKAFAAVTDTSCQSCAICGATPKIMNDLANVLKRKSDTSKYEYGLSTLHAHIRCFECILHVSYRLEIRKWKISGEDKEKCSLQKKRIQNELKEKLGLLVDIPKPNFGTTNDGNTARRFFANYEIVSQVTGIDTHLIKRFGVILKTLSSGCSINAVAFREYSTETARLFIELYPWYYMPSSVHRILIHGADIIQAAILPIGMLSEEALEARNKDLRRCRQFNTRKISRIAGTTDLFHFLLFTSDPVISIISKSKERKSLHKISNFDHEVQALLNQMGNGALNDSDSETEMDNSD